MADLSTEYGGLTLRAPIVASSSPMTGDASMRRRLAAAGAAAIVLPSLFEEQLAVGEPAGDLAVQLQLYNGGPRDYLSAVRRAKEDLDVPVIANLNVTRAGPWLEHLPRIADAGADAIELTLFGVPVDPLVSGEDLGARFAEAVREAVAAVELPITAKLFAQIAPVSDLAALLERSGARGLVLFNRFYERDPTRPDQKAALPSLSSGDEMLLRLRWISVLRGLVNCSLGAAGGFYTVTDVVKALTVGADAVMLGSALLKHGPEHAGRLTRGLSRWLDERGYDSLRSLRDAEAPPQTGDPLGAELAMRRDYVATLTGAGAFERWPAALFSDPGDDA